MFNIISKFTHRQKKDDILTMELPQYTFNSEKAVLSEENQQPNVQKDKRTERLMALLEEAIEQWAIEYKLEKIPKWIIFEQALDVMQMIELKIRAQDAKTSHTTFNWSVYNEHNNHYNSDNL